MLEHLRLNSGRLWAAVIVVAAGVAIGVAVHGRDAGSPSVHAAIEPPVAPSSAPPVAPCLDADARLVTDGDSAILCGAAGCRIYDRDSVHDRHDVARPPQLKPLEEGPSVSDANGRFEVCTGDDCLALGPRLAAAIARARRSAVTHVADFGYAAPAMTVDSVVKAAATRDRQVVVFHDVALPEASAAQAWNTARDRPIELRRPPFYEKADAAVVSSITPIGDLVLVDWVGCAGPCTCSIVADREGRNHGPEIEGGTVVQVALDRFVVLGEHHTITTIDDGRATITGNADPVQRGEQAIRISDDRAAALGRSSDGWVLITVNHGRARIEQTFTSCW